MTSKCGKNKTGTRGDSRVSLIFLCGTDARQHGIYLFYTIKKQTTLAFFISNLSRKAGLCPFWRSTKTAIWRNLQSHEEDSEDDFRSRFSKRQSPTTVLFRTTFTRAITLYELLILLGSNHLQCYTKWSNLIGCYLKMKNFLSCVALILSNKL